MIKLLNNWEIESDGSQYILHENTGQINKQGFTVYRNITYHSTLESAISTLIRNVQRLKIKENNYNFKEALKMLREINEELKQTLDEIAKLER